MSQNKILTIRAGQAVKEILSADATVSALVANKIYPVQIDIPDAELPYITYVRSSIYAQDTKDYDPYTESCTVYISCFSTKYDESISIAEAVTGALVHAHGLYAGINISDIRFQNIDENFDSGCFIQTISFNVID